ncbi:MAG: sulfotransferase [Alphaproteobacteria bacterium]|nr:sulfotransferase [Alphaproteobacteria bacterium]
MAVEYRYPDFLCIGVQKAGTSWLDVNLRRHPQIWLPPMKELQFFSHVHLPATRRWTDRQRRHRGLQFLRRYMERNAPEAWNYRYVGRLADLIAGPVTDGWYGRMFALASPERICGEMTPEYSLLPEAGIEHVLRLSPDVRIILSLRDPIERSWSHIRMLARQRGIEAAAELVPFAHVEDHLERADYAAIVARWRRFIPEDRFHVVFMDDVAERPYEVLEKLCGFLGVSYEPGVFKRAEESVHAGEAQEMPPAVLAALKENLKPAYDGIAALYPEIGARWTARYY